MLLQTRYTVDVVLGIHLILQLYSAQGNKFAEDKYNNETFTQLCQ
jgi:hypothetical protein